MLVSWGHAGLLLGGDLPSSKGRFRGWDGTHGGVPHVPVQVVKVSHHASVEAHHDELWKRLQPAVALVTPFQRSACSQPPRPEQICELARSSVVVMTTQPVWHHQQSGPSRLFGRQKEADSLELPDDEGIRRHRTAGVVDLDNAVAVSLAADGSLRRLVLAGDADVYLHPEERAPHTEANAVASQ